MIVIPIGTRSTLAMKPRVTIGLIVACVLVHVTAMTLSSRSGKDMLEVHRELYAAQMRLYLLDMSAGEDGRGFITPRQANAIHMIETAGDYFELQMGIVEAIGGSCSSFGAFEKFGEVLAERDPGHYPVLSEASDAFDDWKRMKAREEKVLGRHINYAFGLIPSRMGRVYTFFTHMFVHGGIWHLAGNMLFLWVVGCLMEDSWGRIPFLAFYLAGGAVAGAAHALQDTSSTVPLIGASGAIAAAMGAFTVRHFFTRIRFFYFFLLLFRPFWGTFHLPAYVFLPLWFVQQLALKSLSDFVGGTGVAYAAHIGGYMTGVITALAVKATDLESRWLNPMVARSRVKAGVQKDPRFEQACELLAGGNVERARMILAGLLEESPTDVDLRSDVAVLYREHGMDDESCDLSESVLKDLLLQSRHSEAAELALDLIHDRSPAATEVNPGLMLRAARHLVSIEDFGSAHDIYRFIISCDIVPEVTAKASIALARLLEGPLSDPWEGIRVLEDAGRLDIEPRTAEEIDAMRARIESGTAEPAGV